MAKAVIIDGHRMRLETCYKCKSPFAMSEDVYTLAQQRKGDMSFYCPNGHGQIYLAGESETDKLRRERDQLAQKIAEKDDQLRIAWATANQQAEFVKTVERHARAAKGQITKLKKRASNGVCPCCNRTFSDLARHMAGKHPDFANEDTQPEVSS